MDQTRRFAVTALCALVLGLGNGGAHQPPKDN
jgi:hypothetical protein